ncbi:hypothetical protein QBA35_40600 [Streptomyces bottropensis]|jgi:hypothetical protein|uniref:Uncharacterized protein n=1 Tax=Streptomyces bottropensis TaxID=42235 RepID=A0ABU8B1N2_9ACTN
MTPSFQSRDFAQQMVRVADEAEVRLDGQEVGGEYVDAARRIREPSHANQWVGRDVRR